MLAEMNEGMFREMAPERAKASEAEQTSAEVMRTFRGICPSKCICYLGLFWLLLPDMNIAVVKTGGKQYLIKEGSMLTIEKIEGLTKDGSMTLDTVLLTDDGSKTEVGTPAVSGAKVTATVMEEGRGKKVVVVKYKAKSRYFKKRGHRQPFTKVKITKV